jgi:hypothetical protein
LQCVNLCGLLHTYQAVARLLLLLLLLLYLCKLRLLLLLWLFIMLSSQSRGQQGSHLCHEMLLLLQLLCFWALIRTSSSLLWRLLFVEGGPWLQVSQLFPLLLLLLLLCLLYRKLLLVILHCAILLLRVLG